MNENIKTKIKRIRELRGLLKSTDYKAIKYAEGEITATEYAPTLTERRAWRAEINALQTELRVMSGKQ